MTNDSLNLPSGTDDIIALAEKIIERHWAKGSQSPIKTSVIADLNYKVKFAKDKHAEGLKYKRLMEAAWDERDQVLGLGKENTGLFQSLENLTGILQECYTHNKGELCQWGLK